MNAGDPRYLCSICQRLLDSQQALLEHYQVEHQLEAPPDARTPPRRGSRQEGARRFGQRRGNGEVLKN